MIILVLVPGAAANLDTSIAKDCDGAETLISMATPDDTYSNPGPPNMYEWNVCVTGLDNAEISDSCDMNTGFYLSSENRAAHLSAFSGYNKHVCTGQMETRISSGPKRSDESFLFTVSNKSNGHVAGKDVFKYNVYGSYTSPQNVTVSMDFNLSSDDSVYFDGTEVESERSFTPPAGFPYMVSESDTFTSGILTTTFLESERSIDEDNVLSFTTEPEKSSFYVPFFAGNTRDIEEREDMIMEGIFMDQLSPGFSNVIPESPVVRVIYSPEKELRSDMSLYPGSYSFNITKTGEDRASLRR